jgi:hypothetical protein
MSRLSDDLTEGHIKPARVVKALAIIEAKSLLVRISEKTKGLH